MDQICQNPKLEHIICSTMPQSDLVIVQFDNSFVFLWPILCTAYFCWTGSRQMGGLAELIEGEDGAYVEPFSCLAPTSVTASSVETMLMRMLASVPTQSQLGGLGETLPFIIWPLVGIQGRLRFSKSNVLLLSPAFCNFSYWLGQLILLKSEDLADFGEILLNLVELREALKITIELLLWAHSCGVERAVKNKS